MSTEIENDSEKPTIQVEELQESHERLRQAVAAEQMRDALSWHTAESGPMNIMFLIMYILLAVAVFSSLLFTIANLFAHPKKLKKTSWFLQSQIDVNSFRL